MRRSGVEAARFPAPLAEGAAVAVIAPAGPVEPAGLAAGLGVIASRGFSFREAANLRERTGYFAGDDAARLSGLAAALADPEIRAIWAARGGYGTTRLLDRLPLDRFYRDPVWIVGSSDLTALLLELWVRHGVVSIHGPMAARLGETDPADVEAVFELLEGRAEAARVKLRPIAPGLAEGPLVGGNLCVIAHCLGAVPNDFADGALLLLEEVGERPYRVDRYLTQLDRAGILDRVAGIVVGELTACDPGPDGVTVDDVLRERLAARGIPVASAYPAAHGARNAPFLHGAWARLEVAADRAALAHSGLRF